MAKQDTDERLRIRKSGDRGHRSRGWLDARFTFSFADYHDPDHMGFRVLRVLNEDRIAPGMGFGPHAHRDMEILTYVLSGRLRHRDSMGEERILGPNEVQAMSAGTGIVHSEFNASDTEPVHSIQIWIEPGSEDLEPSYQQIRFSPEEKQGRLRLLAGPQDGTSHTRIHQDARVWVVSLRSGQSVPVTSEPERYLWIQVLSGRVRIGDAVLDAGDGAAARQSDGLRLAGVEPGEILVFDLP